MLKFFSELVDCDLVSVKYVDYSCQFETIEDEIFSISGSGYVDQSSYVI